MPSLRNYSAGSIIYFAGDSGDDVFVLQKGRISLISTSLDQKEDTKEDVRKGEFFGVKSALGKYPREETAQVLMDSQVLIFKIPEFEAFCMKNSRIVLQMLKVFSSQLRRVHKGVRELLGEHGAMENSVELAGVGEYYYQANKTDYALYAFDAYQRHYPAGPLLDRVRTLSQSLKRGLPYPTNLPPLAEEAARLSGGSGTMGFSMGGGSSPGGQFTTAEFGSVPAESIDDFGPPPMDDFGDFGDVSGHGGMDDKPASQIYYDGLNQYSQGDYDGALETFQKILDMSRFPSTTEAEFQEKALYDSARCWQKKGNAKNTIEKLSLLMKKFPQSGMMKKSLLLLGEVYEKAKDVNRAIAFYDKASKIPPHDKDSSIAESKVRKLRGG